MERSTKGSSNRARIDSKGLLKLPHLFARQSDCRYDPVFSKGIRGRPNKYLSRLAEVKQTGKKGEKAIWLCMPLTRKIKDKDSSEDQTVISNFVWKPNWFVLSQTNGEPIPMPEIPAWSKEKALASLGIQEIPFTDTNGNVQGYAKKREVAISPLAAMPHKTLFHELAHVELAHTVESDFSDSEITPRNLREVEAEAVAMLLCESLELPGSEFCRGYIQSWLKGDVIPEKSAMKIFGAADRILKAGQAE